MSFSVSRVLRVCAVALAVSSCLPAVCQVAPGSADVAGHVEFPTFKGIDNKRHVGFGFSGGVNVTSEFAVIGEYAYLPAGSVTYFTAKADGHYQNIGLAPRYSFLTKTHYVPYLTAAGGFSRASAGASYGGTTATDAANGGYLGAGGGVSLYLTPHFGVRPEVRYERMMWTYQGSSSHLNFTNFTLPVFFQF